MLDNPLKRRRPVNPNKSNSTVMSVVDAYGFVPVAVCVGCVCGWVYVFVYVRACVCVCLVRVERR